MTLTISEQEITLLKFIGYCQGLVSSGHLGEKTEQGLREHIVATCNAYGFPTIAERGDRERNAA